MSELFDLDQAHEALALAEWYFDQVKEMPQHIDHYGASIAVHRALIDLEAQLPKPCPECGSDQCGSFTTNAGRFRHRDCGACELVPGAVVVW